MSTPANNGKDPGPVVPPETGYAHPGYAASLSEFGTPRALPRCGGWLLERPIPGTPCRDAVGCYPLFACRDWSRLPADLEALDRELVSVSVVTDPFGAYDEALLRACFGARVIPFKAHYVVDLRRAPDSFIDPHHLRSARKALGGVSVESCATPSRFLPEWVGLYQALIARHRIRGISAFSHASFEKQLQVPGLVMFRAVHNRETVGMLLWYTRDGIGYYHLGASSEAGYRLRASFALFQFAIGHFAERGLAWLDLGAGAGVRADAGDGLNRFKRGWSTGIRTAYFCGRIGDPAAYAKLAVARGGSASDFFPAYRAGEAAPGHAGAEPGV